MPQQMKIVEAITPQAGAAITGDYVSLKNCHKAYIILHVCQGAANVMTITPYQATSVAAGSEKVLTNVVPIWANEDCATSDTLVEQTAAKNYALSAATTDKMVIFEIDPRNALDVNAGFDCMCVKTSASAAANITSAIYYLVNDRYAQATPPAAITD